jgi:hypothetical protein
VTPWKMHPFHAIATQIRAAWTILRYAFDSSFSTKLCSIEGWYLCVISRVVVNRVSSTLNEWYSKSISDEKRQCESTPHSLFLLLCCLLSVELCRWLCVVESRVFSVKEGNLFFNCVRRSKLLDNEMLRTDVRTLREMCGQPSVR